MSRRTHRQRLARSLSDALGTNYQGALARVTGAAEAGILPSPLNDAGMDKALAVLLAEHATGMSSSVDTITVDDMGPNSDRVQQALADITEGVVLLTGPTGSGKSRAIYELINSRSVPSVDLDELGLINRPDDAGHTLIVGATGSGKSVLTKSIVDQAIADGEMVYVIDLVKGGADYARHANLDGQVEIITDPDRADELTAWAKTRSDTQPVLLVFEDEASITGVPSSHGTGFLPALLRSGRSRNVRVIVAAQKISARQGAEISNFSHRIVFAPASVGQRAASLSRLTDPVINQELVRGWAYVETPDGLRAVNIWGRPEDEPKPRVSIDQLRNGLTRVAVLFNLGVDGSEAFTAVAADLPEGEVRDVFAKIGDRTGTAQLSEAMAEHPHVFKQWVIVGVRTGEISGGIASALTKIAAAL